MVESNSGKGERGRLEGGIPKGSEGLSERFPEKGVTDEVTRDRLCPVEQALHHPAPALCQPTPWQPSFCRALSLVRLECPDCGCVIYRRNAGL